MKRVTSFVTFQALLLTFGAVYPRQAVAQMRIRDNATGGDCQAQNIGNWNRPTCTLTRDFTGSIEIMNDGIILDGSGKTITGNAANTVGVKIDGRQNVKVQNLKLTGFEKGILITRGKKNDVMRNSITGTTQRIRGCGICLERTKLNIVVENDLLNNKSAGIALFIADANWIESNVLSKNGFAGIRASNANSNIILENEISGAANIQARGVQFRFSNKNMLWYNEIKDHRWPGIWFWQSNQNEVAFNDISNNGWGMGVSINPGQRNRVLCNDFARHGRAAVNLGGGAAGNEVFWNNMLGNDSARDAVPGPVNLFNHPRPVGGNYWQVNAPNCADANGDGFCDAPYAFPANQDKLPHVDPIPWKLRPEVCDEPAGAAPPGTDLTSILEVYDEWFSGYDARDLDLMIGLLADSVVFVPPDGLALVGREAIRTFYDDLLSGAETPLVFVLDDVVVTGSWGAIRGMFEEGESARFRFLMLVHRAAEGAWKISRFIWYADDTGLDK